MTYEESWAKAEVTVYNHLLKATGATDKKNAYLGYLPKMLNVWALRTGRDGGNTQTLWSPVVVSVHMLGVIEGVFAERAKAQEFVMRVLKCCYGVKGVENVQDFRVRQGGLPEPEPQPVTIEGAPAPLLVFAIKIDCDFVFSTGEVRPR